MRISLIVFIIFLIGRVVLFLNKDKIKRKVKFEAPAYETSAIEGKPENVDEALTYKEVSVKEDYIVYVCATPKEENGVLTLYFTSSEKNVDLFKIRVFDMNDNLLGESGLINPNSYIKDVTLNRNLAENEEIKIKVMSYEKETYYSKGSINLNIFVKKQYP